MGTFFNKIRKVELVCYGYGTRFIIELNDFEANISPSHEQLLQKQLSQVDGRVLKFVKPKTILTLKGEIDKINSIGRKYLKKYRGEFKKNA